MSVLMRLLVSHRPETIVCESCGVITEVDCPIGKWRYWRHYWWGWYLLGSRRYRAAHPIVARIDSMVMWQSLIQGARDMAV